MEERRFELRLLALGLAARAVVVASGLVASGGDLARFLARSDAPSYVAVAHFLAGGERPTNAWHERVFLGWPLSFALPGALVGQQLACVVFAALFAALVPVVWLRLTQDRPSSIALAFLTPTWLMHSSMGMSEPAFLLYQVLAIHAFRHRRDARAFGFAAAALVVRPNAVFVWLAVAHELARQRAAKRLALHFAAAAAVTVAVLLVNQSLFGDPLRQAHLYSGLPNVGEQARQAFERAGVGAGHVGLPFMHLLWTPWLVPVPAWKLVFVYAHALAVLAVCALGARTLREHARAGARVSEEERSMHRIMLTWAVLGTAFAVCTGPYWAFHSFDRYCVWALPAYLYIVRAYLPRSAWAWGLFAGGSLALVVTRQLLEH